MKDDVITITARIRRFGNQLGKAISTLIKIIWVPSVALLAVVFFWFYTANSIPIPTELTVEKYGVYGDSFGRITSLFTALGFGGLVITLLLQQRQIRAYEEDAKRCRQNDEKGRYEEILFRLLEIYHHTLSEVRVGDTTGRDVLRKALDRVDSAILEEGVNDLPRDIKSRWDSGSLKDNDRQRIDYLHYRNFKIVGTEIQLQARLVDTFEVLLEHMLQGMPDHLLINSYRNLVFAQITFLECRYFFLVALSHTSRSRLRELLAKTGFFERISHSQLHKLHREMYKEYWGEVLEKRELPASIPMSRAPIRRAVRAHKAAGGLPKTTYIPVSSRNHKGY